MEWRPIIFNEEWTPIRQDVVPHVLPYYMISSYGRIFSKYKNQYLILVIDKNGYVNVNLHLEKGSGYTRDQRMLRVNRLVLASFNPCENWQNLECNHKDSVRSNNYLYNLEWVTSKENTIHGLEFGYKEYQNISGELNPCAKITANLVLQIVEDLNNTDMRYTDIGKKYGISDNIVSAIANGNAWRSVTEGILDPNLAARYSTGYSNSEIISILDFFEANKDIINDRTIYPSLMSIVRDCASKTGLDTKYDVEHLRKTIIKLLRRDHKRAEPLYANYTFQYLY